MMSLFLQHLDVCFYYLRKKIKHSDTIERRVTTTDSLFYLTCRETNKRYPVSDYHKVAAISTIIAEYILGTYHCCATAWAFFDHVVMPVHVEVDEHFVLAYFDIKTRCLVVYNSLDGALHRKIAIDVVKPLAVLIPVHLENTGFYDARNDLDFTQGPYSVPRSSSLGILVAENVPIQEDW